MDEYEIIEELDLDNLQDVTCPDCGGYLDTDNEVCVKIGDTTYFMLEMDCISCDEKFFAVESVENNAEDPNQLVGCLIRCLD